MSIVLLTWFAVAVFIVRLIFRKATKGEIALMAFFVLHTLLIQAQMFVSEDSFLYNFRYHAPSYPLLYGWCAYPFVALCRRWKVLTIPMISLLVVAIVRTHREVEPGEKIRRAGLEMYQWAADVVKADWKGDATVPKIRARRFYRPSLSPSVAAPPAVAYLVHGRQTYGVPNWWKQPVEDWEEMPDYIFLSRQQEMDPGYANVIAVCNSDMYEKIAANDLFGLRCRVYRRKVGNGND